MPHSFIKRMPKARQSINSFSVFNGLPYDRLTSFCLHITSQAMYTTTAQTGSSQSPEKLTTFFSTPPGFFRTNIHLYINYYFHAKTLQARTHRLEDHLLPVVSCASASRRYAKNIRNNCLQKFETFHSNALL